MTMKHEKIKKALAIISVLLFSLSIIFGIVFSILYDKNNSVASADEVQPVSSVESTTYYYINAGGVLGTSSGYTKTFEKIVNTKFPADIKVELFGLEYSIFSLYCAFDGDNNENVIYLVMKPYDDDFMVKLTILENQAQLPQIITMLNNYITQDRTLWDNWIEALGIEVENDLQSFTYSPNIGGGSGSYDEGYQAGYDQGYHDGDESGYQSGYDDGLQFIQDELDKLQAEYDQLKERYDSLMDDYSDVVDRKDELDSLLEDKAKEIAELEAQLNTTYNDGFHSGYQSGYREGNNDGYLAGESFGWSEGYDEGHRDGMNLGQSVGISNPVSFFFDTVQTFLSTNLFGTISIGAVLSVIVFVAVALAFLKMFSGG